MGASVLAVLRKMIFELFFLVIIVYLARILWPYIRTRIDRVRGRLPGGPPAYPLIGTLGLDCPEPWLLMQKWSQEYGKGGMFTYFQGPQLHVAVCDPAMAKILYNERRLDGKADSTLKNLFAGHGMAFTDVNAWKEFRKFGMSALRELRRADFIASVADVNLLEMVKAVEKQHLDGCPFHMRPHLFKYVANSMADVTCGPSLRADTIRFGGFFQNFDTNNSGSVIPHDILNVFPWLAHFPPFRQEQARVFKRMDQNVQLMKDIVAEHRATYDAAVVRDYIDAAFQEMDRLKKLGNKTALNDVEIAYLVIEMYFAGYVAILAMIEWSILIISSTPEVQRRCQEEIRQVLGQEKTITYNERSLLPYCEATFHEITRLANVDPVGLAREAFEDVAVPGTSYVIPKGATLFINYFEFQMSEKYWPDAISLKPERFLDDAGHFRADANNYAFGIGRRSCSGDTWSKDVCFVAFVTLLQHFTMRRADTSIPWQNIPRINGIGVYPDNYDIIISKPATGN